MWIRAQFDCVERVANEDFALLDAVVGMLVAGGEESVVYGIFAVGVTRFDETVGGQAIVAAVGKKIVEKSEIAALIHEAFEGHGHRGVVIVDAGIDVVLGK